MVKYSFAFLSAFLLSISFPNSDLNPVSWFLGRVAISHPGYDFLSWVAFLPLFLSLEKLTPGQSFKVGLFAGVVHYLMILYWIIPTINRYGGVPLFLCIPILLLLAFYLALYMGIFTFLVTRFSKNKWVFVGVLPFVWVFLEYIKSFLFTGFPWELLGYSLHDRLFLSQLSDITGVYGLSFVIMLINILVYRVICELRNAGENRTQALRDSVILFSAGAMVIGSVYLYGKNRVMEVDVLSSQAEKKMVSVVQGNIEQAEKWDVAYQDMTIKRYFGLSQFGKSVNSDLIIWPETAVPFVYNHPKKLTTNLKRAVKETGVDFLMGIPSAQKTQDDYHYYNSAFLISANGNMVSQYDKAHLVPYGEYVPLKKYFPFINKLVAQAGNFKQGPEGATLKWGDEKISVQICFEIIFPSLARKAVNEGASLIANITNDAWFGTTAAPFQHFSMLKFRSIENRRSLARAANTGISGFIDPVGRVLSQTPLFEQEIKSEKIPLLNVKTFYTKYGDVFAWVSLIISSVAISINFRNNRKDI